MSTDIHNNEEKNNSRFFQLMLSKSGQWEEALHIEEGAAANNTSYTNKPISFDRQW